MQVTKNFGGRNGKRLLSCTPSATCRSNQIEVLLMCRPSLLSYNKPLEEVHEYTGTTCGRSYLGLAKQRITYEDVKMTQVWYAYTVLQADSVWDRAWWAILRAKIQTIPFKLVASHLLLDLTKKKILGASPANYFSSKYKKKTIFQVMEGIPGDYQFHP